MTVRTASCAVAAVLAVALGACEGEPAKPPAPDSDAFSWQAVQAGPRDGTVTVHYLGPRCSEVEAEPQEGTRKVVITLSRPHGARCSGPRAARTVSIPLEGGIGNKRIIDGSTKEARPVATCRNPGAAAKAITRSICRLEHPG